MHSSSRFFGLILFVSSFFLLSLYMPKAEQEVKGLYVNDFKNIIGQKDKETALLNFAKKEGFNYLLLYNLGYIHKKMFRLNDAKSSLVLAQFIYRAKTEFGITQVGAVGETAKSFDAIDQYNQMHQGNSFYTFDVYNIEFEFWNKNLIADYYCPTYINTPTTNCSKEEAFDFYLSNLKEIKKRAHKVNIKCETYIGKPTPAQCKEIGKVCDRVLVHYYRSSDLYKNGESIYQYHDYRLSALAPEKGTLQIMPIFSARDNHMGPWLEKHSKEEAYETFNYGVKGFEEISAEWKEHIKMQGAQWYRYTDMAAIDKK